MCTKSLLAASALAFLSSFANGHMIMNSPVPYGKSSLNNSPLNNAAPGTSGSDFPCKQRSGVYDITTMNNMPVGVPQVLSFTGGATHGGGSCQVSVTTDKEPNVNSQWKVIHSIVSGCPSNSTGNLSGDPKGGGAATFEFSIPKGMANGEYSLAWTWFNKIGNREMYMNCAPITVTGGASDMSVFNSLPDMFVANLPREQCSIPESVDFIFPSPGDSVETPFSTALASTFAVSAGCAAMTKLGAGAGKAAGPTAAPAGPVIPVTSAAPIVAAPTNSVAAPTHPALSMTTLTVTYTNNVALPSTPVAAPPAPALFNNGSCPTGSQSCSSPGALVCIGSSQFGICDTNMCAVAQPLAAGTTCSAGVVTKRSLRVPPHARTHRRFGA